MKIVHKGMGAALYEDDATTIKETLVAAIKAKTDLTGAYLTRANLTGANLTGANLTRANLTGAYLTGAYLTGAYLTGADLTGADLTRANLTRANLTGANLTGANLTGANLTKADLTGTTMPGLPNTNPATLSEAAKLTADWLAKGHWIQQKWIETPTGAYAGDCKACLHGAAVYIGGKFGPELSQRLVDASYDVSWNDREGRTVEEVIKALLEVSK